MSTTNSTKTAAAFPAKTSRGGGVGLTYLYSGVRGRMAGAGCHATPLTRCLKRPCSGEFAGFAGHLSWPGPKGTAALPPVLAGLGADTSVFRLESRVKLVNGVGCHL